MPRAPHNHNNSPAFDAVRGSKPTPAANEFMHDPELREALYRKHQAAKRWMWLGVIGVGGLIFVLWGWSIFTQFSEINWRQSAEGVLAEKAKDSWDKAFKEDTAGDNAIQQTKEQLKTILNAFTATSTTSTPAVTSTIKIVTTSTLPTSSLKK